MPRFMVIIKASPESEAGVMPSEQLLTAMGKFNDELIAAGVMKGGDGLHPSSKGVRVRFGAKSDGSREVINGPFAETKELIAGFWIWELPTMAEAIAWLKRCPDPMDQQGGEVEIRPIFGMEDFGEALTPELRAQEDRQRAELEAQAAGGKKAAVPVPPPEGATPYLTVRDAPAAIAFYQQAFGAELSLRLDAPDGVLHAELTIGGARFMLSEERLQWGAPSPLSLGGTASSASFYVPDVDAVAVRAVAAGATLAMPVQDQFWGDRSAFLTDPFGHKWMVATHLEDLSPQQLEARAAAAMASPDNRCAGS